MTIEFDHCETKFGACSCRKVGEAMCPAIVREAQDPEVIARAKRKKHREEQIKRSKYIRDDEGRPMRASTMARLASMYPGEYLLEPGMKEAVESFRRMYLERPPIPVIEASYLKRQMEHTTEIRLPEKRERRLGLPAKKKPHHVFLEDPVKRRRV